MASGDEDTIACGLTILANAVEATSQSLGILHAKVDALTALLTQKPEGSPLHDLLVKLVDGQEQIAGQVEAILAELRQGRRTNGHA